MSAFMDDVAGAALPVAIGLLILAAVARAVLWAQIDDADVQRVARQYVEPLATWCLVAAGTQAVAVGAAGNAGLLPLVLPIGIGVAAVLLRSAGETDHPAEITPAERPARPEPTRPAPAAAEPSPAGRLWAEPGNEAPAREGRLWSR
jgi:hypothetical protein